MDNMLNLKRRITRTKSTRQITQAMQLVSTAKAGQGRTRMEQTGVFVNTTEQTMRMIANSLYASTHPYFRPRRVRRAAVVVIGSDRGLCGGYNIAVSKTAIELMERLPDALLIAVGKKPAEYFRKNYRPADRVFDDMPEAPFYDDARRIGDYGRELFLKKEIDELYVAYTRYHSIISQCPEAVRLLPVPRDPQAGVELLHGLNEADIVAQVIPQYINTAILGALIEASVCEQSARVMCMDQAVKNSTELIDDMLLDYNRARQGAITQELNEIIGGYNAL